MPFLDHFGLETYPFGLTPNPDLYFPWPQTEALLAALRFSLARGDGLLKIVGEVGTGKTLACRLLLEALQEEEVKTAYLNAPVGIKSEDIPALVAAEFGVKVKVGQAAALTLRDFLLKQHKKGSRCVLVIDEAQALGAQGLEVVRLLSNLETNTDKLLQIVLFGQAELDGFLEKKDLRQIRQRIQFNFYTKPLPPEKVAEYLAFRCERSARMAGRGKAKKSLLSVSFAPAAAAMIARRSGGLPRLIHVLADKALLAAYAEGAHVVSSHHVRAAARETAGLKGFSFWPLF